ncbi:MAG TPA: glycosyltransferase 87 family protein [Gaiellaceae bacterium]
MSSRSSLLPPADLRRPALLGAVLLVASWAFICFTPLFGKWLFGDARFYENWGSWIAAHQVPYRDFNLEYPPGAIPTFVAPVYMRKIFGYHGFYFTWLRIEILVFSLLALVAMLYVLARLGVSRRRAYAVCVVAGISPAVLGPITYFHFDYWPSAFAVGAVAALVHRRGVLACALSAAGAAAKVYPVLLIPIALYELWRRGRWRAVAAGVGAALAVLAAAVGPFLIWAPHGLTWALNREQVRPLEVESIGAGFFMVAHALTGAHIHVVLSGGGSHGIAGGTAKAVSTALSVAMLAALVAIYARYFRSRHTNEDLLVACASVVVAYIVFSKVFSPQYLLWLAPLVPLLGGRRGLRASALLLVILAVTQIFEPYRYAQYFRQSTTWIPYVVFLRNMLVVGLLGLLVWPQRSKGDAEQLDAARAPGLA